MKEMKIINGFVKYFLPNYGPAIENLILYGSLTINDNTVRRDTHDNPSAWISWFILGTKNNWFMSKFKTS